MRKIKDLFTGNSKVWFYIGENDALKEQFANELKEIGLSLSTEKPLSKDSIGPIMSVTPDGNVTYVSVLAWSFSFDLGDGSNGIHHSFHDITKIDYAKYVSGATDYVITSCTLKSFA